MKNNKDNNTVTVDITTWKSATVFSVSEDQLEDVYKMDEFVPINNYPSSLPRLPLEIGLVAVTVHNIKYPMARYVIRKDDENIRFQ